MGQEAPAIAKLVRYIHKSGEKGTDLTVGVTWGSNRVLTRGERWRW